MSHLLFDMAKAKTEIYYWFLICVQAGSSLLDVRLIKNHSVMPSLFVVELHHVSGDASLIKLLPAALW